MRWEKRIVQKKHRDHKMWVVREWAGGTTGRGVRRPDFPKGGKGKAFRHERGGIGCGPSQVY